MPRQSRRLEGWDYSRPWWYAVTIIVANRNPMFGRIIDETVVLSPLGTAAKGFWSQIPKHHANVELDEFEVMPDHLHGIIVIKDDTCRDVQLNVPTWPEVKTSDISNGPHSPNTRDIADVQCANPGEGRFSAISPKKGSLSVVVRTFKAEVTTWARRNGYPDFQWQERFYDHIIRNDRDLQRIREYIHFNPLQKSIEETRKLVESEQKIDRRRNSIN